PVGSAKSSAFARARMSAEFRATDDSSLKSLKFSAWYAFPRLLSIGCRGIPLRGPSPLLASPDAFSKAAVIIPVWTRAMLPSVAEMICWNWDEARPSTSDGRARMRSRSGSFGLVTSRTSLQPAALTRSAAAASVRIRCMIYALLGSRVFRSEARADDERECPQLRERERIHRVDQTASRGTAGVACTHLRIEAQVIGPRLQVAADHTDRPVTEVCDPADVVGQRQLAELHETRVLDHAVVRPEDVVEAADAVRVAARPGACTVVVADRLCGLDALAALVDVVRQEVEVGPVTALVPHALTECTLDECVEREALPAQRVRHAETVVRQRVTERQDGRRAILLADQDRHAPRRLHTIRRLLGRQHRVPQVVRDAHGRVVTLTDPHDVALVVDLEGAARAAALRAELRGHLGAGAHELAAVQRAVALTFRDADDLLGCLQVRADEEGRHVQLLDDGAARGVACACRPAHALRIVEHGHGKRCLPRLAAHRARVLPLPREPGRDRDRDRQDLVDRLRVGVRHHQAVAAEQLELGTDLLLGDDLRAQLGVAERVRRQRAARTDREGLVLRAVVRYVTRGTE